MKKLLLISTILFLLAFRPIKIISREIYPFFQSYSEFVSEVCEKKDFFFPDDVQIIFDDLRKVKIDKQDTIGLCETDYYNKRFGENINSTYIHVVREIGEIALAIEKENSEHAKLKITEAAALLEYMASKYKFNLDSNMQVLYSR